MRSHSRFIRTQMSRDGMSRIENLRDSDLVLYNDCDEIPNRDLLLFLKLYDGFENQPVQTSLRHTVFGLWWQKKKSYDGGMMHRNETCFISSNFCVNEIS